MSVKESPLAKVKRVFGTKEKLVDSLVAQIAKDNQDESEEALKQRLLKVSNQKLLRLANTLKVVGEKHGGKEQLVGKLGAARGKAKDQDYMAKLSKLSLHQLVDMTRAAP